MTPREIAEVCGKAVEETLKGAYRQGLEVIRENGEEIISCVSDGFVELGATLEVVEQVVRACLGG